jgi:hypothetical protein
MDPITWATALRVLRKYWWVLLVIGFLIYVQILRTQVKHRDEVINQQIETIASKNAELRDFKTKFDTQNKAIDDMAQKGKEQASKLDVAIAKVNAMKPATQVIIREIYTDQAKTANDLLYNALVD